MCWRCVGVRFQYSVERVNGRWCGVTVFHCESARETCPGGVVGICLEMLVASMNYLKGLSHRLAFEIVGDAAM
jgi:hypothetical protein